MVYFLYFFINFSARFPQYLQVQLQLFVKKSIKAPQQSRIEASVIKA